MLQTKVKMKPNSGFSLLEVIIAAGIISLIVGATTTFMSRSNDQLIAKSAKIEQQKLYQLIKYDMMKLAKIQESVAIDPSGNAVQLKRCLYTNAASNPDCIITSNTAQKTFNFFTKLANVNRQRTGPAVKYSLNGIINCSASTPYCPFWTVESSFWATCPDGATKCDQASNVHVRFIVKPVKSSFRDLPLEALPNEKDYYATPSAFAISHNLQNGRNQIGENQDCPSGAQMSGLEPNGKIKCICRAGFTNTESDPSKPPICIQAVTTCLPGQRIKGRQVNGSVLCVDQVITCKTITFGKDAATCPVGGWLENINLGYCKPGPTNKKGTDRGIKCDIDQGRCCYYEEK